jgi:hypothetical protein
MERKHCPKCNETKSVDEFSRFDKWKHLSKHCSNCQADRRTETEIYKDGMLNTNQGKGYNWLLGYSIIKF